MPVVAQVSDLHLSPRVPERQTQAELVLAGINAAKPDLTVVTGDLTDDGWERPEDLAWARRWLPEHLQGKKVVVPGNHDVGNFASLREGRVCDNRIDAWGGVFGNHFRLTLSQANQGVPVCWNLLLCNSMVFGSGLDAEHQQLNALNKHCAQHHAPNDIRWHTAVFLHSPFFVNTADEPQNAGANYWLGPTKQRQKFYSQLQDIDIHLIASGHVHQTRLDTVDGTGIVWAPPASGTWVHAPGLPNPPAPERTGFVLHHLGDDGSVRSEVVECAPMLKTVFFDPTAPRDG